ncbi:putative tRNA pseudouridine synthase Pus10 [Pseudomyrmex gracilis]|uniref:putative tRNA pseudouridine synthase Pus10 n=1 Tax=Pseudomyrmex gracilis TaxID=219809 RepID=UPI000995D020|nr:putative tRNA pseudouridine synthase Pus10 [Pseudomyrmex gracilis]
MINIISTEEKKKVFYFLKSQGCCSRCCLRLIGYRVSECYRKPFEFATQEGFIVRNDIFSEKTPCIICLGILQDIIQENLVTKIVEEVKLKNYDSATFACALTIPVSVKPREHILYAYISRETGIPESIISVLKTMLHSVKDVWKSFMIPKLEEALGKASPGDASVPSPFLIEVSLTYTEDEAIFKELINITHQKDNKTQSKRKHKNKFSRKNMETVLSEITNAQLVQYFTIPQIVPKSFVQLNVSCSHTSIFIGGRYNKLSRELSQTPWLINGEKKVEFSVQDLLCNPIAEAVKAESIKFLSSGREDVDVRNVYNGRPFAVELLNPHMTNITDELLMHLATSINQSTKQVQITSGLKVLSRFDLKRLKEGENVKTKFYRALCVCRNANADSLQLELLNELKNIKIVQRTPVRVLHRRPLSPRMRVIYEMRARWAKDHELSALLRTAAESADMFFVLDVKTQAGTYVKEFVHGDFGRTQPSLCDLLNTEVDIVALDVTSINLNWP